MKTLILASSVSEKDGIGYDILGMSKDFLDQGQTVWIVAVSYYFPSIRIPKLKVLTPSAFAKKKESFDLIIYHYTNENQTLLEIYKNSKGKKILRYHNTTPASFFVPWSFELFVSQKHAEKGLLSVIECTDEIWSDSQFNADHPTGLESSQVLWNLWQGLPKKIRPPYPRVPSLRNVPISEGIWNRFFPYRKMGHPIFLSVGRIVPNKNWEDCLRILHKLTQPKKKKPIWIHSGSSLKELKSYEFYLQEKVDSLHLENQVFWLGITTESELKTLYLLADALLHTSLHEGYGLPIAEAIELGTPVVSYPTTAIPEVLEKASSPNNCFTNPKKGFVSKTNQTKEKIAIAIPRWFPSVVGGAESLAFQVAQLLKTKYDVHILTSTAKEYSTWKSELHSGRTTYRGVEVHRFHSDLLRTKEWHFQHKNLRQYKHHHWTKAMGREFLYSQGPISHDFWDHLQHKSQDYKAIFWVSSIYPWFIEGSRFIHPNCKQVLIPTLHDEPVSYLSPIQDAVSRMTSILWNTKSESDLGKRIWKEFSASEGILPSALQNWDSIVEFRNRKKNFTEPYLIYVGRIDESKGVFEMVDAFLSSSLSKTHQLYVVGHLVSPNQILEHKQVRLMQNLSSNKLMQLVSRASASIQPSRNESLSLTLLESFALGTPVAGIDCPINREHLSQTGFGSLYKDKSDWEESVREAMRIKDNGSANLRAFQYVESHYSPAVIQEKLTNLLSKMQ